MRRGTADSRALLVTKARPNPAAVKRFYQRPPLRSSRRGCLAILFGCSDLSCYPSPQSGGGLGWGASPPPPCASGYCETAIEEQERTLTHVERVGVDSWVEGSYQRSRLDSTKVPIIQP